MPHSVASSRSLSRSGIDDESIPGFTKPGTKSSLVGKIGNLSVQYNLGAASIAVVVMCSRDDTVIGSSSSGSGDYPEPDWAQYSLLGMVFFGAVCGMLSMGYLGDVLGRRKAMMITLGLVVLGSLGSGLFAWGNEDAMYGAITACRFLVGMGVGGIYPLSAVQSAENADDEGDDTASEIRWQTASRIGWAFFWQVPGQVLPYLVCLILVLIHYEDDGFSTNAQFRIIFVIGAIPASIVMWLSYQVPESQEYLEAKEQAEDAEEKQNPWEWAMAQEDWPAMRKALIGTALTWFLYDISFYGTVIFTPQILKHIFGSSNTLADTCWQSILTISFGIPGCVCGILYLKNGTCYKLNLYGFYLMAVAYAALAIVHLAAPDQHILMFIFFLFINFAINNGPSVATFVLPAMCFPTEVRSTFHGVSAASAKLGALAGTFMYKPLPFDAILWIQVGLCMLGALVTYLTIPRTDDVIGRATYDKILNDDRLEEGDR